MQKRIFLLSGLISLLILNIGCSKDDDPQPQPKTKTELLTAASWKFDKIDPALAATLITCFTDNTTTFLANGTGTCPDTGEQCTPPTGAFNWNFTNNETVLHLDATLIPAGANDFAIVTLDETNLVVKQDVSSPMGNVTVTITFKH